VVAGGNHDIRQNNIKNINLLLQQLLTQVNGFHLLTVRIQRNDLNLKQVRLHHDWILLDSHLHDAALYQGNDLCLHWELHYGNINTNVRQTTDTKFWAELKKPIFPQHRLDSPVNPVLLKSG